MKEILVLIAAVAASGAIAQTPDCPKADAAMPMRPPQITQALPPDAVFNAEEGHISAILIMERSVKPGPIPEALAPIASDLAGTPWANGTTGRTWATCGSRA